MGWIKGLNARARSVFGARSAEARMEEEFRFHLEMETARLVEQGFSPDDARRQALIAFGGVDHHREAMRDGRGARWLADFAADVRYALRGMRRSPGFAIAVAVTLGIGIGVNGVVFGFVNTLLFRPITGRASEQLVGVYATDTRTGQPHVIAYEDFLDLRDRSGAFQGLAGMMGVPLNLVADVSSAASGASDMIWGEMVTEDYFAVLGLRPALGHFFTPADATQGTNAFAVLSYDAWRRRYGGDSTVVGRNIRINGREFTVTGVAAQGFHGTRIFGFWPEVWVPVGMHDVVLPGSTNLLRGRGRGWVTTVGRMNEGWTLDRTRRAATVFANQLASAYPASNANTSVMLIPAGVGFDHPAFMKPGVLTLASVMGVFASIVTVLIVCANLANLQLARAAARAREFAIRLSVGCSRSRLTRQLLVESFVFAAPGALLAAVIVGLTPALEPLLGPRFQFQVGLDARADLRVVAYTTLVAAFAVIAFGLVPALRLARPNLVGSLSSVIGAPRVQRSPVRLRAFLVVSQLAMSVVLLVAGVLFVRSLVVARRADVGFDADARVLVSVNVGLQGYDAAKGRRFYEEVVTRVRDLQGVAAASWAFPVPFDTHDRTMAFYVEGLQTTATTPTIRTEISVVGEDFVPALGLRLQGGRELTRADSANAPEVMVVSRSLANRFWPGRDPVGQRVRRGGPDGPEVTVVGVVADARFANIGHVNDRRAYLPLRQHHRDWQTLVVHARGEPRSLLPAVRRVIAGADPTLPAFGVGTMTENVARGFAPSQSGAVVAGFFGVFALLIAAVGLYAVVAGGVAERTREIGVRQALGATPAAVLRFVMLGGARLGVVGLAIGLVAALGAARGMRGLLVGLSPADPFTFALVPLVLGLVVLIATFLPARRAVKLDPVAALRSD